MEFLTSENGVLVFILVSSVLLVAMPTWMMRNLRDQQSQVRLNLDAVDKAAAQMVRRGASRKPH